MKKNIYLFLMCLFFLLNGSMSFGDENMFDEDMTEEEWEIIENWELLDDLDFLKEDLDSIEELGDDEE